MIIDIELYNAKAFDIWEKLNINLCVIVTFFYMIAFVGMISKANNKRDIYEIIIFSITSIYLLYKANKTTFMYIMIGIYLVLAFAKLQILPKTKNRKILKSICFVLLIAFITNMFFYQQRRLEYRMDYPYLQERVANSKMIGKAELRADLQNDAYTQYVYHNFSSYSFIYLIENYGKICGIFIIATLMLLFIKLIFNYQQTKNNYGKMLSLGIGCLLFIPIVINFFTRVGIVDFQSVNIPFVTHNDVNIIIYMISISLIMSIYSRKNIDIKFNSMQDNI